MVPASSTNATTTAQSAGLKEVLLVGRQLGEGGFCAVHSAYAIPDHTKGKAADAGTHGVSLGGPEADSGDDCGDDDEEPPKPEEVVFKALKAQILACGKGSAVLEGALEDFRGEAQIFESLGRDHPNIIRMYHCEMDEENLQPLQRATKPSGCFLVLEKLQDTLEQKLGKWKTESDERRKAYSDAQKSKNSGIFTTLLNSLSSSTHSKHTAYSTTGHHQSKMYWDDTVEKQMLLERLHIGLDIAAGISHLHAQDIIYRDVKPNNIGFDLQGGTKLFDFGLARHLPRDEFPNQDSFAMSGEVGSLRYIAPEIARNMPYNCAADVYSFAILLWEVCVLESAYDGCNAEEIAFVVAFGKKRPEPPFMNPHADHVLDYDASLRILIEQCWANDPANRPSMMTVMARLQTIVNCLEQEVGEGHGSGGGGEGKALSKSMRGRSKGTSSSRAGQLSKQLSKSLSSSLRRSRRKDQETDLFGW